jgi:hypothetical protein
MAKKEKMEEAKETYFEETEMVVEQLKVTETPKPKKDTWEIKDRVYILEMAKSL